MDSTIAVEQMLEMLSIIGFPSLYGGAGAELYRQITIWEKLGLQPSGNPQTHENKGHQK